MSKIDENLSEMLNIPTTSTVIDQPTDVVVRDKKEEILETDLMKDYEESRKQLKEIVSKGAGAIDDILAIARESEHPRAFEVAATMIKTVADANEKLLAMQKQMKEITGAKNQNLNVGKAAIFVGSTSELSKMIKNEIKTIDGN
jgi:tetrahydromethanopterin S-methyltransferase subunit A